MDGMAPAKVRDNIIDEIRKRERNGAVELPRPPGLKPGDQVRILSGAFAGHLALYAGMKPHERSKCCRLSWAASNALRSGVMPSQRRLMPT